LLDVQVQMVMEAGELVNAKAGGYGGQSSALRSLLRWLSSAR